jgi:hypothetical protein
VDVAIAALRQRNPEAWDSPDPPRSGAPKSPTVTIPPKNDAAFSA